MSFRVRLLALVNRLVCAAGVTLVVGPRPDEAVVVVLLDEIRRPAPDPRGGDHGGEQIPRDGYRVEQRGRVECRVGEGPLPRVVFRGEAPRHVVPHALAGLAAGRL